MKKICEFCALTRKWNTGCYYTAPLRHLGGSNEVAPERDTSSPNQVRKWKRKGPQPFIKKRSGKEKESFVGFPLGYPHQREKSPNNRSNDVHVAPIRASATGSSFNGNATETETSHVRCVGSRQSKTQKESGDSPK